jgi:hypothetical protein
MDKSIEINWKLTKYGKIFSLFILRHVHSIIGEKTSSDVTPLLYFYEMTFSFYVYRKMTMNKSLLVPQQKIKITK